MNKEQYHEYMLRMFGDIQYAIENKLAINLNNEDQEARIFFLEEERKRLIQKLEVIENLTRLAWGKAATNPEEVEDLIRQINFHSK
jgi:hypothetical protein